MRYTVLVLFANSEKQESKLNKNSDNLTFNCRPDAMRQVLLKIEFLRIFLLHSHEENKDSWE